MSQADRGGTYFELAGCSHWWTIIDAIATDPRGLSNLPASARGSACRTRRACAESSVTDDLITAIRVRAFLSRRNGAAHRETATARDHSAMPTASCSRVPQSSIAARTGQQQVPPSGWPNRKTGSCGRSILEGSVVSSCAHCSNCPAPNHALNRRRTSLGRVPRTADPSNCRRRPCLHHSCSW